MTKHRSHHFKSGEEDGRKEDKKKSKKSGKDKVYGPYKGSKQNGGRPIYVIVHPDGSTTSTNKARKDYEDSHHTKLSRDTDVDHRKGGGREGHDGESNLRALSHKENVAKENKRRAHSRNKTDKYEG